MADPDLELVLEFSRRSGHPLPDFGFLVEPDVVWEDEEETEDETESEDEDGEPEYITVEDSPNDALDEDTSNNGSSPSNVRPEEERNKRRREGEGEACSSSGGVGMAGLSQQSDGNPGDNDGPSCPICFQAWTTDGEHRIWSFHFLITHFANLLLVFQDMMAAIIAFKILGSESCQYSN